ncbi:MAG: fasciclin domain-containing protein [Bacteroidota bacterium]
MRVYSLLFLLSLSGIIGCTGKEPEDPIQQVNLLQTLINDGRFVQFVAALNDLSLSGNLEMTTASTVFAPTDLAFANAQTAVDQLSDPELSTTLLYHIANGRLPADGLSDGQFISTGLGSIIVNLNPDGSITLTDQTGAEAAVLETNLEATNGVIHVIDKILLRQ